MATKKFSVANSMMKGLEDTIRAAENYSGELRHEVLKIENIELDEDNPRDLKISKLDVINGLKKGEPLYQRKRSEMRDLESLANSIRSDGLINPILVFQNGSKYKVLAGERRTLASLMAGKEMIHARIMDGKPDEAKVAILQWVENVERKDLSLLERRDNLLKLKKAFSKAKGIDFNAKSIVKILGCSTAQSYRYLALMQADDELVGYIKQGTIQNLKDLERLNAADTLEKRKALLDRIKAGLNISNILKPKANSTSISPVKKSGRQYTRVNFGSTKNKTIAEEIISILLSDQRFKDLKKEGINSGAEFESLTNMFAKIVERLEGKA